MRLLLLMLAIAIGVFAFLELDEYERYKKNIQIEAAPAYASAQLDGFSRVETGKHHLVSYILKYKFSAASGEYSGSIGSLTEAQRSKYRSAGSVDVAYASGDPSINTVRTYFRPGQTTKEFHRSFVVTAILGVAASIPLGLLFGWRFGWLRRKRS